MWTKILIWLKAYWYVPPLLVILSIILIVPILTKPELLKQILNLAQKSHEKELAVLEKTQRETKKKKEEAQKKYDTLLQVLEQEELQKEKDIVENKEKKVKKILEKYDDEEITKKLAEEFGIVYKTQ